MEFFELSVEKRETLGKSANNRLRKEGRLPAVVYSGGDDALSLSVEQREFVKLAKGALPAQLFKFKSEDSELDGTLAFVKDLDIEPIKESLLHVDFLSVKTGQSVSVNVPLKAVGETASVREGRAILNQTAYQLTVDCLPSAIPTLLEVDVSQLEEGQSILAKEVPLPEGAVLKSSDNQVVASLLSTKKGRSEDEAQDAPAAVEGEAGTADAPADEKKE